MRLGAMNHPGRDPVREIEAFAALGFDFIDLTLEPPRASSWLVDEEEIAAALSRHGLDIVGHTAYYLPVASPFPRLRRVAAEELKRCAALFAHLGARFMNVHPFPHVPFARREEKAQAHIEVFTDVARACADLGLRLMVENDPQLFNSVAQFAPLFDAVPELGLHWDIGHANLRTHENTTGAVVAAFRDRLCHVHISDNKGDTADLHLPIGVGDINWKRELGHLKRSGYDGTVTIEAFAPDRDYLAFARRKVRDLWDSLPHA
jgi:sugar phosphate isomerase/epimerase